LPTPTYTPLATVTLGSSASSVTFSSIPATYRDLILVVQGTATGNAVLLTNFNGDTGSNYTRVFMTGTGTAPSTASDTQSSNRIGAFRTDHCNFIHQIMDYSATDKHKTSLTRQNAASFEVGAFAGRWANTAAITSVVASLSANQFASGCTFSLYGVIA
jgi:hypothetical protein